MPAELKSLPTTIDDLRYAENSTISRASVDHGLAFQPRPTDVMISPYSKSGTTWLQQIVQGLRTRGSMAFDDIDAEIPWLLIAHDLGRDLNAEQVANPRAFKSHRDWHSIPKGGKYICSFRHPADRLISDYRFMQGMWFDPNDISLSAFAREFVLTNVEHGGYWFHLSSWWEQRENPNVLLLCYEDMQADLAGTVRTVADFIGIELDDELGEIVVRQSSRDFMLEHRHKFDFHQFRTYIQERSGYPLGRIATVTNGASLTVPPDILDELDANWKQTITSKFGFKDYAEFREAVGALRS